MSSILKIENLKYKEILKDVTFSLEEKTFNILVGANGSGKTTLVNCLRGLSQYQGTINIFNCNIKQKDNLNLYKEIGFFLNDEILLEDIMYEELLSLLKNLDYEEEKAKKLIFSIAKKLDITELLFKIPSELLDYQKSLISFVFSIIHEPKLLIVDNDLDNLDEKNKSKIIDYLKNQKKLTILFITNDSEYFNLADNFLFLDDGKIILSCDFFELKNNEKTLIKCGTNLPFAINLSSKLMVYELLDSVELDFKKMVDKIWK